MPKSRMHTISAARKRWRRLCERMLLVPLLVVLVGCFELGSLYVSEKPLIEDRLRNNVGDVIDLVNEQGAVEFRLVRVGSGEYLSSTIDKSLPGSSVSFRLFPSKNDTQFGMLEARESGKEEVMRLLFSIDNADKMSYQIPVCSPLLVDVVHRYGLEGRCDGDHLNITSRLVSSNSIDCFLSELVEGGFLRAEASEYDRYSLRGFNPAAAQPERMIKCDRELLEVSSGLIQTKPDQWPASRDGQQALPATAVSDFVEHIRKCWVIPPGAPEEGVKVKVRIRLNRDGSVAGTPEVVNPFDNALFAATARSTVAAIFACQKYDSFPASQYDLWKEIVLNFDSKTASPPQVSDRSETPETSGKRVALLIGNSAYKKIPWLENPDDDARAMRDTLSGLGFEVTAVTDASMAQMRLALLDFSRSLGNDTEAALVFYSGHAIEIDSHNYLLPTDIAAQADAGVIAKSLSLGDVIDVLESAKVSTKILILDACRNNPMKESGHVGLAPVQAGSGTLIAYSTAPGTIANDGDESSGNSPYTSALLAALRKPNRPIEEVFREVRASVIEATDGKQIPWESSSLLYDFSFLAHSSADVSDRKHPTDNLAINPDGGSEQSEAVLSNSEKRILSLFHSYTEESLTVVYMRDGKYIPAAMRKIDYFLRDWRTNEKTSISPQTIDLIWELHADLSSKRPIHILAGYLSPASNPLNHNEDDKAFQRMHQLGKAVDLFFPDVPTEKVRNLAIVRQVGGVGFYRSGDQPTDFVHIDSGPVRYSGPSITKKQLARIMLDYRKTVGARNKKSDKRTVPEGEIAEADTTAVGLPSQQEVAEASSAKGKRKILLETAYTEDDDELAGKSEDTSPTQRKKKIPLETAYLEDDEELAGTSEDVSATPQVTRHIDPLIEQRNLAALCVKSLNALRTDWDDRYQFRTYVTTAKSQGLTVGDCRVAVGLEASSPSSWNSEVMTSLSDAVVCASALDRARTAWDANDYFQHVIIEAKRRGLTLDDCRSAMGLRPTNSSEAVDRQSSPTTPKGAEETAPETERASTSDPTENSSFVKEEPLELVAPVKPIPQNYPVPRPRPKPIEVLMMAAINMKIEPVSPPPPDQIARKKPAIVEGTGVGVVPAPETMLEEPQSNVAEKTSIFWWPQQVIFDPREAELRDGTAPQFTDTPISEHLPGVSDSVLSTTSATHVISASGKGDFYDGKMEEEELIIGSHHSPISVRPDSAICSLALNRDGSDWEGTASSRQEVREALRRELTVEYCRYITNLTPTEGSAKARAESSSSVICFSALNYDRRDWSSASSSEFRVAEARRRGLTVPQCRALLGLVTWPEHQVVNKDELVLPKIQGQVENAN